MTVGDLCDAMAQIADPRLAEPWDNVGLIAGDPAAALGRVRLCIDLSPAVLDEAGDGGCVIAYHPPIFKGVTKLTAGHVVFEAIRRGISVYTPHTALDVAAGGTNDVLADVIGLENRRPLRPRPVGEAGEAKLVTFVPPDHADAVADALFAAGAGRIGDYRECSFRTPGTGTFRGDAGTNPAVGEAGRRESVDEVRLETVVPAGKVAEVVAALRAGHPYEEPAFDLFRRLDAAPQVGLGRVGDAPAGATVAGLVAKVKAAAGVDHVLLVNPQDRPVKRAACCAGSCGDLLDDAARAGADFYLTGELKHHDALRAARLGLTVCCLLHSNSERMTLPRLIDRLAERLPGVDFAVNTSDRDPFTIG